MATVIETNATAIPPEQKYFVEAEKRKRSEGTKQFEQLHFSDNERLRSLATDPWADHAALDKRPLPVENGGRIKFCILGAGMGGITMAISLIKKGFAPDQMIMVEAAGGIGGTWYWNRYPGLHCDVESYCYLPFLEDTGYVPKQKYSSGVEIRTYLEDLVNHFGLQDRVLFRTQATGLQWDDSNKSWNATFTMGHGTEGKSEKKLLLQAEFALLASGLFPYPQVPRVAGLADFEGPMFHTSRWNYEITGGSYGIAFPDLDKLKNLRVGVIGTGATAIQAVPLLAKYAKELYVFQRTPSQVNPRGQRDTDAVKWKEKIAAKPGWQKERMENLAENLAGHLKPGDKDLVDDYWSKLEAYCAIIGSNRFGRIAPDAAEAHIGALLALDSAHTTKAREHVRNVVKDESTADKLTPWYPTWCKRPTFSDTYLETFNNEHVHLVDTDGKGLECITSKGIVANGQEYPIDVLVLSTGYRSPSYGGDPGSKTGIEIVGRNNRRMADKWDQQGLSTLHGVFSNDYPNLFFQSPGQAAATANYVHVLNVLSEHIASIIAISHERTSGPSQSIVVEASAAAEDAWGMELVPGAAYFSSLSVCTPGYITLEGEALRMPAADDHVAMLKMAKSVIWQGGLVEFMHKMEEWRRNGLKGVEISVVDKNASSNGVNP